MYFSAAKKVFSGNPETVAFIYGHTHKPSIDGIDGRYIINTGTWLKQFDRVKSRFGLLPAIYVPFYCLNYFKLKVDKGKIFIEYIKLNKEIEIELSLLQRFMVSRKRRVKRGIIPKNTRL